MSGSPKKATTEQIIAAYRATGTVWKAARELGMAGQTVHERLVAIGFPMLGRNWTAEEVAEMRLLAQTCTLGEIGRRLGRPYSGVAGKMSELEIPALRPRSTNIPRGAGFDLVSVKKHMKALEKYKGTITQYARAHSIAVDLLVRAIQRHDLAWWDKYAAAHTSLVSRECEYCRRTFYPTAGKQRTCSRQCQSMRRVDRDYFGGNRRNTIGLAEGRCQLCARTDVKGLSSHHMLGKENDPENGSLIALCQGCHKLVTLAASRNFVDNPHAWQSLIALANLRKFGDRIADGKHEGQALWVTVEIEWEADDAEEAKDDGVA